jgi:eukaryotic-like serine/threonine-protein kinase
MNAIDRSDAATAATQSLVALSPRAALRLEEIERSRVFFRVVLALTIGGMIAALPSHGDPTAKAIVMLASVCSGLAATYVLVVALHPDRYHPRLLMLPGIPVVFGALAGVYYWGAVSPVTGMLVYGIYFFSLGKDARFITANYALIASLHGLLCVAIMSGVIDDRGLVPLGRFETLDQIALLSIIETLYLIAFITARLSEQATLRAVSKLEQAVRAMTHQDALLAEARAELDRVRAIGGPGKYTQLTVGSYRLGKLIGRGGIGEVYDATHVGDRHVAAVKLLRSDALGHGNQVQRLLREAEATARIECPNVVRVLDVGTTNSGVPFIAMERMHGHDLANELRSKRRLSLAETRIIVDDIAAGLEAVRRVGIVHRDLKPHNVFGARSSDGRVWKILDFGVSKLGATGTLTAGNIVGTPSYMSPEQARGEDVDHRADVYALAAIVFRAVTGHAAFGGNEIATILYDVVHRAPVRPSSLAELPTDVDRVLAIGLAKERTDRFETAGELARWFAAAICNGLTPAQRARGEVILTRSPWHGAVAS